MRIPVRRGLVAAVVGAALLSCTSVDNSLAPRPNQGADALPPGATPRLELPPVRFSEIHYDNTGTDAGEAIEISGPAGTDVTGWTIVLYNGSGGASYTPLTTLSGTIPATCGPRGVIVTNYAVNGIQNGSPDGMALVTNTGTVIEFLSYEGVFVATNGPANGMTSVDIGVSEAGTEPLGQSLQRHGNDTWTGPSASTFGACNDDDAPPPPPPPPTLPATRFTEIHYDNAGTDAGEAIEIEGPAGADLTGWTVVLYNGGDGASYNTTPLSGIVPSTCGGRGVIVLNYAVNGIQNGSPDGFALVDGLGHVVEFLSYEGTFTATNGPALGLTSADIGVSEAGTEPLGQSLSRDSTGAWHAPAVATFGTRNDPCTVGPPPGVPDTRLAEIHYDNSGTDVGEAIEVEGPAGTDVTGWSIVLYNGNDGAVYGTTTLSGLIPATCTARGVVVVTYPSNGIQNGSPDGVALIDAGGTVVEFLSYEGTFVATNGPAVGLMSTDIGVSEAGTEAAGQSLNRDADGVWHGPATATFGACNGEGPPPPPPGNTVTFSGRLTSDPPLPVGYEDQLFATLKNNLNVTIATTFTWASLNPDIATIDENGVMHALAAGSATFQATAAEGTVGTFTLPMAVATLGGTAVYGNNTEFGDPVDADPSDDFIIRRLEYTTSYNPNRGSPNWVSYDLEASHIGAAVDRCDCFTHDPELPAGFTHLTTNDYTGAGAFAGYGIDRGHMARSFDRTAGSLDNATTYYLSNVVPQAADLNQGPWAIFENYLGDRARNDNREVYIITGPAGNKGTVKGEGKIVIPTHTWKVAVIMPHDQGLADVHDYRDLEVIAVIMPNEPGVRNVDWHTYITTVDAVEALTGYDLLARLPDKVERAVESGTQPPLAAFNGPYASNEGSAVSLSAAGSVDPNGSIVSYAWTFGDGGTASGVTATHTWTQDGLYAVRLIVTDNDGLADTITTSALVANVAPVITALAPATLLLGGQYTAAGSFTDPGADPWSATITWGDGTPTGNLPLSGKTFSATHTYCVAGSYNVSARVSDDDVTASQSTTVTVLTAGQGLRLLLVAAIQRMVDTGRIQPAAGAALIARIQAAASHFDGGRTLPARLQLEAMILEMKVLLLARRLSQADADAIRDAIQRLMGCLTS